MNDTDKSAAPTRPILMTEAAVLLAVLTAAHHGGDKLLASVARETLEQQHGIRITFVRPRVAAG